MTDIDHQDDPTEHSTSPMNYHVSQQGQLEKRLTLQSVCSEAQEGEGKLLQPLGPYK